MPPSSSDNWKQVDLNSNTHTCHLLALLYASLYKESGGLSTISPFLRALHFVGWWGQANECLGCLAFSFIFYKFNHKNATTRAINQHLCLELFFSSTTNKKRKKKKIYKQTTRRELKLDTSCSPTMPGWLPVVACRAMIWLPIQLNGLSDCQILMAVIVSVCC